MAEDWRAGGFGLYIHWPFCQAKCPYCDFNSHVSASIDHKSWANAYLAEIDRLVRETEGRILNTIFFGGGTPSLMDVETVDQVIEKIRKTWPTSNDLEITMEANPTSVEADRFKGYHAAGVNRLSLGVQALNDADLKALGRLHSVDEALSAYDLARAVFPRTSFDLIYARQHQTEEDWRTELGRALSLGPDHLSLYQLTIEDGTAFGDRHTRGRLPGLPDEDRGVTLYEITQELCQSAGLPAYEVSNHARPGDESRHNKIYWQSGDYIGIGPGAHGRLTINGARHATETRHVPGQWLADVAAGSGESLREQISDDERLTEFLLMGLRLREGVSLSRLKTFAGSDTIYNNINNLVDDGLLQTNATQLSLTDKGRPLLNAVLAALLDDR